jgi:hypothetical protein
METFLGMEVEQLDGKISLNLGKYISLQADSGRVQTGLYVQSTGLSPRKLLCSSYCTIATRQSQAAAAEMPSPLLLHCTRVNAKQGLAVKKLAPTTGTGG